MFKPFGIIEERKSEFNGLIQVVGTAGGPRIVVDGVSQSGGLMKEVWSAGLKKLSKSQQNINDVLILGLGGGSVAEVVNKHYPTATVTGLDIDIEMVELGKKYLQLSSMRDLKVVIADAYAWVLKSGKSNGPKYDLVLVDLFKGDRIPEQFYSEDFITNIKKLLKKNGVMMFNHLYSFAEKEDAKILLKMLRKTFIVVTTIRPEANIIFIVQKESD